MPDSTGARDDGVCNTNILEVLEFARQLIILADEGEAHSRDDGCVVLYGVVRDCAYKMRSEANRERAAHKAAGRWTEGAVSEGNETLQVEV